MSARLQLCRVELGNTVHASTTSPLTQRISILQNCCHGNAPAQLHTELEQVVKILAAVHDGPSMVLQDRNTHKEVKVFMMGVSPKSLPKPQNLHSTHYSCMLAFAKTHSHGQARMTLCSLLRCSVQLKGENEMSAPLDITTALSVPRSTEGNLTPASKRSGSGGAAPGGGRCCVWHAFCDFR